MISITKLIISNMVVHVLEMNWSQWL